MTAVARYVGVQAQQWEATEFVIEADAVPACLPVAVAALLSLYSPVRIVTGMAAVTSGGIALLLLAGEMTGLAVKFRVLSAQWKLGINIVIEAGLVPAVVAVAIIALSTIAAAVHVIAAVTVYAACAGNTFHAGARGVTALAVQRAVGAEKLEPGIPVVIEANLAPLFFGVAQLAVLAALPLVCVVETVAGSALCWRGFISLIRVAGGAACFLVPAQ